MQRIHALTMAATMLPGMDMGRMPVSTIGYEPPRGSVRGKSRTLIGLHRDLAKKGQRAGHLYDYLFPGEARAAGQKRLMLNVGTDRRRKRQVRRMNERLEIFRGIFAGTPAA